MCLSKPALRSENLSSFFLFPYIGWASPRFVSSWLQTQCFIFYFFWLIPEIRVCPGFGWERVNGLHSSWSGALLWICAENSVGNTGMFWLLLSSAHTVRAFSAPQTTPPVCGLGVHKKLGGDTAQTAEPSWPKWCSTPYTLMLSNKKLGEEEGRG